MNVAAFQNVAADAAKQKTARFQNVAADAAKKKTRCARFFETALRVILIHNEFDLIRGQRF